jgi:hypothetical protein
MSMTITDAAQRIGERVHYFDPWYGGGLPPDGVITGVRRCYVLVRYDGQSRSIETDPDALTLVSERENDTDG